MVKLMQPKWNLSFSYWQPVLNLACWNGLSPFSNHLQGGFHPAHILPPPLAAGWELAHPALLLGDWYYVRFCRS